MRYFDIKRDNELIASGSHFFCEACVIAWPLVEQSPDPRYCLACYKVLMDEASLLPSAKRPAWIPKSPKIGQQKTIPVPGDVVLNKATIKGENSKVAIIQPETPKVIRDNKRGPKHKDLPLEQIIEWQAQGLGSKAIATKLNDQGIEVGFRTIARILSGQRVLL